MGDNTDDIFQSFELSDEQKNNYKTVKAKFYSYLVKRKNVPSSTGETERQAKVLRHLLPYYICMNIASMVNCERK